MAELDPTERALLLLSLLQTHRFWPGAGAHRADSASAPALSGATSTGSAPLGYPVDATPGAVRRVPPRGRRPPPAAPARRRRSRRHRGRAARRPRACRSTAWRTPHSRALAKLEQVLPGPIAAAGARGAQRTSCRCSGAAGRRSTPMRSRCWRSACRDHEQIRFDYRRRDGDETSRLVEPHQLVSTGRRWYLVAWDVRRDDWRTFRLDRLERPRLAGVRCVPRPLPGGDAAAFVAESIRTMPLPLLGAARRRRLQPTRSATCSGGAMPRSRSRATVAHAFGSEAGATTRCCASSPCSRVRSRSSCGNPKRSRRVSTQLVARLRR